MNNLNKPVTRKQTSNTEQMIHQYQQEEIQNITSLAMTMNHAILDEGADVEDINQPLLEAMALLIARLRFQLDHQYQQHAEHLCQQLSPSLTRPIPSLMILQCEPSTLIQTKRLLAETLLVQQSAKQPWLKFSTSTDAQLNPLLLSTNLIDSDAQNNQQLTWQFSTVDHSVINQLSLNEITLYIDSQRLVALGWIHQLLTNIATINITINDEQVPGGYAIKLELAKSAWLPLTGMCRDKLAPLMIAREYAHCFKKFAFLTIKNLHKVAWPKNCCQFQIAITFKQPLPKHLVDHLNFKINCLTAINLVETDCEPINLHSTNKRYSIIIDSLSHNQLGVFDIQSVRRAQHQNKSVLNQNTNIIRKQDYYLQTDRRDPITRYTICFNLHQKNLPCIVSIRAKTFCQTTNNSQLNQTWVTDNGTDLIFKPLYTIAKINCPPKQTLQTLTTLNSLDRNGPIVGAQWLKTILMEITTDATKAVKILVENFILGVNQISSEWQNGALVNTIMIDLTFSTNIKLPAEEVYLFAGIIHHIVSQLSHYRDVVTTTCHYNKQQTTWSDPAGINWRIKKL